MPFEFDPNKTYEEHIIEFQKHLETIDPVCAGVLFKNLEKLMGDGDVSRARANRTSFNSAVLADLNAQIPKKP